MQGKCRWKAAILILCGVGLLKEFRPSGPFLVDYAVDYKNFTAEEVTHDIIPATSLSYIGSLLLLMLVTDSLCYKPIIITGALATVATWVVTIWLYDDIMQARFRQGLYGVSVVATELAYFTYMYANIEKSDYKKVTSYTHSAVHMGQFLSGLTGQLLLSFHVLGIDEMNYLSLGGGIAGLILSLFLPRVFRDFVANGETKEKNSSNEPINKPGDVEKSEKSDKLEKEVSGITYAPTNRENPFWKRWKEAPGKAKNNFVYAYTNRKIIKWSLWWALAYALYIQVDLYIESLWKDIEHHSHQKVFNGAVHASHAIISVGLGLLVGATKLCWMKWGCLIFGVGTMIQGGSLYLMSQTHDLYVAYGCFIVFQTFFQVLVIIAKSQVAEEIKENSEAFIFGINTFTACLIQLVLTFLVVGKHGFRLPIRDQYIVYGTYALVLGFGFLLSAVKIPKRCSRKGSWTVGRSKKNKVAEQVTDPNDKDHETMDLSPNMPYSLPREH